MRIDVDDFEGRHPQPAQWQPERVRLESPRALLPRIESATHAPRPMWKHPAFIVSVALTLVAMAAMVVLLVFNPWGSQGPAVEGLRISSDSGAVSLEWAGAVEGAEVYAIDPGSDEPVDLSQLVRGQAVWIPAASGLYTDRTCFVVRPLTVPDAEASVPGGAEEQEAVVAPVPRVDDHAALASQGAAAACVSDAA